MGTIFTVQLESVMTDTENLQGEIDTLLIPSDGVATPETQQQPQVMPMEQIQVTPPELQVSQRGLISEIRPATESPQLSPNVPPIQRQPIDYSIQTEESANKQFHYYLIIGAIGLFVVITLILLFRQKIFGPLTYLDCLAIPESRKIALEPKYCVTPKGDIFFENKKDAPPKNLPPVNTIDQKNPPETILPSL